MPSVLAQRARVRDIAQLFIMSASLYLALYSSVSAEVIRTFDVEIAVEADSSLVITETIDYDFEGAYRHGIFRNIKETHAEPASSWYKTRYIGLELLSVTRDGQAEPYLLQDYDGLSVRIGDPDATISGRHTYKITYTAAGALGKYGQDSELYWNVTGNEWTVPILEASVLVTAISPSQLMTAQDCYVGDSGSSQTCASKSLLSDEASFMAVDLMPGEQLTVAQSLSLPNPPVALERVDWSGFWLAGIIAWFIFLGIYIYRWRFKYRPAQPIVAQYEPYEDFKPMFTGVLFDNRLDPRDITAGIIYLAQQGFISIKQTTDRVLFLFDTTDYEVTLLRSGDEAETEFQSKLLELLFGFTGALGDTPLLDRTVRLSLVKKDRAIKNAAAIQLLKKAVVDELVKKGFLEQRTTRAVRSLLIMGVPIFIFFVLPSITWLGQIGFGIMFLLLATVVMVAVFALERRTRKGFEALYYLKGFKEFLSVTDKERFKFHNAPDKNPQQFMEYLPYAIAFGVEKEWAEVFKDIQISNPDWYSSNTGAHFSAVSFSQSMGAFSSSFASSTGSSGSGGGGSSGGGGGGGGGGSW